MFRKDWRLFEAIGPLKAGRRLKDRQDYGLLYPLFLISSLNFPGLKKGTFLALTWIFSPVCGFRP